MKRPRHTITWTQCLAHGIIEDLFRLYGFDRTAIIIEASPALPAPTPEPMLPYFTIFTPALISFIDRALEDWGYEAKDLCGLSCETWMEAHILIMQAKTPQGVDYFYWFITKFDYDQYFHLHV